MNIEINENCDEMKIKAKKEEIKKAYTSYDKFVMYHFLFDLLEIIGEMYNHIMRDEKEIEEMSDEQ